MITFALVAACVTVLLFALNIFLGPKYGGDVEWYIAAAEGRWNELIEPYSARFLHPFLVTTLSRILPLDIYQSFSVIAVVSIFLFFLVNIAMLKDTLKRPLLLVPLFFIPYFFDTLRYTFHPDALYLMLTALFFLTLFYKKESLSLVILFLLFLTRESTLLLGIMFMGVSWVRSKKLLALAVLVVMLISLYAVGRVKDVGQPNPHQLSGPIYMASKLSYNFMTNALGIVPWVNTSNRCDPALKISLPPLQSLGDVRAIGVCGFDGSGPARSLITLLTIFGIAPLVLVYVWRKRKSILKELPLWMLLALIFGVAHFILGVMAGTGVQRLVGYGWPAFLLVTPFVLAAFLRLDKKFLLKLSLVHLFVAWLPLVVQRVAGDTIFETPFIIFVVLVMYMYAFHVMKKQEVKKLDFSFVFGDNRNHAD
ncbi:MAG: hypothetical protein Q7J22_00675 [Candidatus Wolfebacteria bacterium]|nr:hypothetical protein [Candidatus Wolfebacteria bacterium]